VRSLSQQAEALAADTLGLQVQINGKSHKEVLEKGTAYSRQGHNIVKEWVARVKLHFGQLADTPADRMVLERWLGRTMEDEYGPKGKGARLVDRRQLRQLIPYIVEFALLPDVYQIEAKEFAKHSMVVKAALLAWQAPSA